MNVLAEYGRWRELAVDDDDLILELAQWENWSEAELADAFGAELAFGTGGLRGIIGAGTNRMNIYTVRRATQGLANHLSAAGAAGSVAIAYDSRVKSELFARQAAKVLAVNGIRAYIYPRLMPTPCLSFAVRYLKCDAGICITASHNPAEYNGYKVYGPDGGQITTAAAEAIQREISALDYFDIAAPTPGEEQAIETIGDEVLDAYIREVLKAGTFGPDTGGDLRVVYTPLNGAGRECVVRAMEEAGLGTPVLVRAQAVPDGNFPTCPSPNPENPDALVLALETARANDADIVLASDPDCDRIGVAVRDRGEWHLLTGNEVGVLLLDYICKARRENGSMPEHPVAVNTVVTTDMAESVCRKYGVELRRTLTGFKFIGEQIGLLEKQGEEQRFIFGFEESCGYLSGSYVRDKDGVNATVLICRMAREYAARDLTLVQALEFLYREHGYYANALHSIQLESGACPRDLLEELARRDIRRIGDVRVSSVVDYQKEKTGLPKTSMLEYRLEDGSKVFIRPSGTEPKVKVYLFAKGKTKQEADEKKRQLWKDVGAICAFPPAA